MFPSQKCLKNKHFTSNCERLLVLSNKILINCVVDKNTTVTVPGINDILVTWCLLHWEYLLALPSITYFY